MKYPIAVLAMVAVSLISSTAMANEEDRTEFYDFDHLAVDGEMVRPECVLPDERAEVENLVRLRTSFFPEIEESAEQLRILD